MTREEQIQITESTKVSTTIGAIFAVIGVAVGAAGATMGWKATAENRIVNNEKSIDDHANRLTDHDTRLRKLELDVVSGITDIKAELRAIKERLK